MLTKIKKNRANRIRRGCVCVYVCVCVWGGEGLKRHAVPFRRKKMMKQALFWGKGVIPFKLGRASKIHYCFEIYLQAFTYLKIIKKVNVNSKVIVNWVNKRTRNNDSDDKTRRGLRDTILAVTKWVWCSATIAQHRFSAYIESSIIVIANGLSPQI